MTAASIVRHTPNRYDVVDLSLADSAGLSSPGGFAIVEKYSYTREAMAAYMRALKPGGILSVTLWNKEEPPKSVLKLYATMAARRATSAAADISKNFYVAVGLSLDRDRALQARRLHADEIAKLNAHTKAMSFDEIYYPGIKVDTSELTQILQDYRDQFFYEGPPADPTAPSEKREGAQRQAAARRVRGRARCRRGQGATPPPRPGCRRPCSAAWPGITWSTAAGRRWPTTTSSTAASLTNHQPYFAAYIKVKDLLKFTDRLELVQDEWGYLLLWATLGIATIFAAHAGAVPADLRLAHDLQPLSRQGRHDDLFPVPRAGLHHRRGRHDRPLRAGALQRRPCRPRC